MEEADWRKHWKKLTEWAMKESKWKQEMKFLEKSGIRHILRAPQIADMGRWKEEVKFIVCQYHQGYLWLDQTIEIIDRLIYQIISILKIEAKVLKSANTNKWMQFLIGSETTKHSKGLLINKITDFRARWTVIIISLCFTPAGQESYVKMEMVKAITQVYKNVERFN
jgi:hypothetical protein